MAVVPHEAHGCQVMSLAKGGKHLVCAGTAALAPDTVYDKDGCFSGSAVELQDGRQLLMYTGVMKEPLPDGGVNEIQTQCIAIGDGRDYEKYSQNPVLGSEDLPQGGSIHDFRDPKIWKERGLIFMRLRPYWLLMGDVS